MPYKLIGKTIYSKATGKWKKKQTGKSVASAKRALKLLQGLESGSIKRKDVGKGKFAKNSAHMHKMPGGHMMSDAEMRKGKVAKAMAPLKRKRKSRSSYKA